MYNKLIVMRYIYIDRVQLARDRVNGNQEDSKAARNRKYRDKRSTHRADNRAAQV